MIYLEQRDTDHARRMLAKAPGRRSRLPIALDGAGKAYLRKGQPEKAVAYFQRAVELQPDSAKMHFELGQAFLKVNEQAKAQKEIAKAAWLQAQDREKLERGIAGKLPAPKAPGG